MPTKNLQKMAAMTSAGVIANRIAESRKRPKATVCKTHQCPHCNSQDF